MPTSLEIKITSHIKDNYTTRITRGLQMGGLAWMSEAKQYPPKMQGPWPEQLSVRTGNLGQHASYNMDVPTRSANLTAPTYYRYLLLGTGLFGPTHSLIYPTKLRMLGGLTGTVAGVFAIPTMSGGVLFRRYTRGSIWEGKLTRVKAAVVNGVQQGLKAPV